MSSKPLNAMGRPRRIKVDLGEESSLPSLPMAVEVGDAKFFLVNGSEGYKLLSVICPMKAERCRMRGRTCSPATATGGNSTSRLGYA